MSEADPELALEQAHLDRAHHCLDAMVARADEIRAMTDRAVRDENTVNALLAQWKMKKRQVALAAGSGPLCFGRIDEEDDGGRAGDRWYVGRRHVEDEDGDALVIDWRAPVAAPFYRATAIDPVGLVQRRRLSVVDREVVAYFDEDLSDPDGDAHGGLPDPLLAELDRERTGQMRDIVATIAAEQDVIIRSELDALVVVQGGPGTGKTAVGLHRAAFLLFQHRDRFMSAGVARGGVLVVGPNPLFLRYIADVLPSLGETAVVQTTLVGLLAARHPVRAADPEPVATIKGDLRMASVIGQLIRDRISAPADGLEVRSGLAKVRFSSAELDTMLETALARDLPSNQARDVFRRMVVQEAWRRHGSRVGVDPAGQPSFTSAIAGDPRFKKDIDKMWPNLSAPTLIRELLGSPSKRRSASTGVLTAAEQELLRRKPSKKVAAEAWTAADLPLLDEAIAQTAGVPATYGHVVVDEAQDHSAMALRMLGRRADGRSMTVLGDLAQATAPAGVESWSEAVEALLGDDATAEDRRVEVTELTVGYRVPASILEFANRLVGPAAPGVTAARSVRPGGAPPLVLRVERSEVPSTVVAEVSAMREETSSVAVVAVDEALDDVEAALSAAGVPVDRVGRAGLPGADAVALVDAERVKGLEFDGVIVVEPSAIVGESLAGEVDGLWRRRGLRRLYVALTRSVQHLGIVHVDDLPGELAANQGEVVSAHGQTD